MILTFFIVFISILGLVIIHELGHFVLAKKFGVKVEEFGIGLPPRIFGKKIGETVYSLNLLPFGAFVKIYGEEGEDREEKDSTETSRGFSKKPIWQRALIVLGGVLSFWLVAFSILSFLPTGVAISAVKENSPAYLVGLTPGDIIEEIKVNGIVHPLFKISEAQVNINGNKGEEIILTIQRGEEKLNIPVVPRVSPPPGEGALGIGLSYGLAKRTYPLYQAPLRGLDRTIEFTLEVLRGWKQAILNAIKGVPTGVEVIGPVGIFTLFTQIAKMGISYFLLFLALFSIYAALFNLLPIPAVDGGKILFLLIEKVRGKPVSAKIEQKITAFFFVLIIIFGILVTIKDIYKLL